MADRTGIVKDYYTVRYPWWRRLLVKCKLMKPPIVGMTLTSAGIKFHRIKEEGEA